MSFVKEWTYSICITIIIAVIFSFFVPRGNLGKTYKTIISLFICLSFFYPLANFDLKELKFPSTNIEENIQNNTDRIIKAQIIEQVNDVLSKHNINSADVDVDLSLNKNNEVIVEDVQVAVSSKYDLDHVKQIIYDDLGIVARVVYIGQ